MPAATARAGKGAAAANAARPPRSVIYWLRPRYGDAPILGPAMILPALIGLALFQFIPIAVAVLNSFQAFNPFTHRVGGWVGFANFAGVLGDPGFRWSVVVTLVYVVLILAITIPLSLALALLLNRRVPGTTFVRAAVLGALAASEAVTSLIWNQMYDASTGLFNALLTALHLPAQPFLIEGNHAIVSIVVMSVWKDVGLSMLLFLAGLQAIPGGLHEAAALDGASSWKIFQRITLPLLRPSLVLVMFIATVGATRLVTPILILTQGGPGGSTTNMALYAYNEAFNFNSPGRAAASVVCMMALLALLTAMQALLLRRRKGMRR
jgi:ABC-type sugar transport system permease subunit